METYVWTNCGSRLPCGLCMITQNPCPYFGNGQYEITCNNSGTHLPNTVTATSDVYEVHYNNGGAKDVGE